MKGKVKENTNRKLYTGFAQSAVVAINPDNEGLRDLGFNIEETKEEPTYLKVKEDGTDQLRLDFFMQEVTTSTIYKRSFFLEDKEVVTKTKDDMSEEEKDDFVPKYQYVNATGDSFYSESEGALPDYFTKFQKNKSKTDKTKIVYGKKAYRVARVGEADLMSFIKVWLNEIDYWDADTNILLDMKKLFNGNYKELQEQVDGDLASLVVDTLGVNISVKDGETKEYQDVYKTTLPGYLMKTLRNKDITPEFIEELRAAKKTKQNPDGRYLKDWEQLLVDITDRAYPWKGREYTLAPMTEFDPSKSFVMNGEAVSKGADDDDSY